MTITGPEPEPRPGSAVRTERALQLGVVLWCLLILWLTLDWAPFRILARLDAVEREVRELKAARR